MLAKGIYGYCKASNRVRQPAMHYLYSALISDHQLEEAVPLLQYLVMRYPPSVSHLTNLHPIFLRACVAAQCFKSALSVISEPITEIDRSLSELHYNDNLIYHYAGGIVYAALKQWAEAEDFFEIVVGSPAQIPSAIQMEALKKLALVQLIAYGKV